MRFYWLFCVCFVSSVNASTMHNYPITIGGSTVIIQRQLGKGKVFVHVHQNETTALQAAKAVIKADGGSLLTLVHSGKRNIVFYLNKSRYEFDPNRIFTDAGIKKTLRQFGQYTPEAHTEVRKLADKIKSLLPSGKIIAVHNNESYSLKNYYPGHELADDAQALTINQGHFYRNFYLVTQQSDYFRLKKLNFNSIWQSKEVTDDGSLSVYLMNRNYINVEAGYGELLAQIQMLKYA